MNAIRAKWRRVAPYFLGQAWVWWVAIGATVISSSLEPVIPWMLQPLLDQGFSGNGLNPWFVPAALVGVFGLRGLSGFVGNVALSRIVQDALLKMRLDQFDRLQDAELSALRSQSAASLSNATVFAAQSGAQLLVQSAHHLIKDGVALIALLVYLFWLNWRLTLVVLLIVPVVALIMRTFSKRVYRIEHSTQSATADLAYVVEENVLAMRSVRLHGAQRQQRARFGDLAAKLRRLAIKTTVASAAMTPLIHITAALALSAVIVIALVEIKSGLTVGSFASFVTAMLMLIAPMKRLSETAGPLARGLAAVEAGLDWIEQTSAEPSGQAVPEQKALDVQWRSVEVQYPSEAHATLKRIDLEVPAGKTLALVGPSGSGKTTLANLVPRFVECSAGEVRVGGVAVSDWDIRALRESIAMVSQDVVMLNATLAANVALGDDKPDRARIDAALRAAYLGDVVDAAPQGIDTPVGHNANTLSGGQRQRLAIARAIYKNSPLIILDEATSALDSESERWIQDAMLRLLQGRTCIVIAHRLSTIERADEIAVIEGGQVVERGTHAQLLARSGAYTRLHAAQSTAN
jgi:ATP-binding cassette, subfamily B, bacterial MsbA